MDPATLALITSAVSAAGSVGGGYLAGRSGGHETHIQKRQRRTIDEVINSLKGKGKYSDLFNFDEKAFQKSYVEPAKALFNNQVAPQIQQQYIASGQQRGTGLEDTLARAGVDMTQLLNQQYATMQENALNRKQNAINSILGAGAGGTQPMGSQQALTQAGAGYLSSDAFSNSLTDILKSFQNKPGTAQTTAPPTRKGFQPDWSTWQLGDKRWNQ